MVREPDRRRPSVNDPAVVLDRVDAFADATGDPRDEAQHDLDRSVRALPHDGRPGVLLIVGVTGARLWAMTSSTGARRRVERDPARFFTGRERPMCHHFVFHGIDGHDFAFVFDIDVNAIGCGIDRGKFRLAPERNCGDNLGGLGVDHGDGTSAMIENVNFAVLGIIDEGIGTFAGPDF